MLIASMPAKYRPELEAALGVAIRQIQFDMKLSELRDKPGAHYVSTDDSLEGNITVFIADEAIQSASNKEEALQCA